MSFINIIVISLIAVVILGLVFLAFHILFALLPIIIVVFLIWLLFFNLRRRDRTESSKNAFKDKMFNGSVHSKSNRKKARNVHTKDVDD